MNAEQNRMANQRLGIENWRLWGPYLSERAWGTVREDYSAQGDVWQYFDYEQACARAYRWSEDGLAGISDEQQQLCFALGLWNGRDPILKERAFGLTGKEGNHGEDVKEYYFYRDATPSHSYLVYLYKYPQAAYPYDLLRKENASRGRQQPAWHLLDTGVFDDYRYWDVQVTYAKAGPSQIHIRIDIHNHGPEQAMLHVLSQCWFRNTWSWGESAIDKPQLVALDDVGAAWGVRCRHASLGDYYLYGKQTAQLLFTENDSNTERLWQGGNGSPYVKDAFHQRIVHGDTTAVNPAGQGSKCAAWYQITVPAGQHSRLELVLSDAQLPNPFINAATIFLDRRAEADTYYQELLPEASAEDHRIMRQAFAGMIWCKQFFHYDVDRWLDGDRIAPPVSRHTGRNSRWRHFHARHVLSMPDSWEYPWFAAWDLAYHCGALALVDVDFAKDQIETLLKENFFHPNGQIPAYEWSFSDVNPPVHAMGALKVFRAERIQRGQGDLSYLKRVFNKLLLNYSWWINRKDADGNNVFEGGFLGLDNISVFDRSEPLPPGYSLKQADATGWMASFALNLTVMALELATEDGNYEDIAIQTYRQFLAIANTVAGFTGSHDALWDSDDGFFKDLLCEPDGTCHRIDVYSWVGIIPLFACEVLDRRLLANVPRFREILRHHKGGLFDGHYICACPDWENERGEHLLALADHTMLPDILHRLLREDEFLSPFGIRSVSRIHQQIRELGEIPGIGKAVIDYVPGESTSGLFGGNSNWRGPIWMPTNYSLIQALERYHRFLGDGFTVAVPCLDYRRLNLREIANLIAQRLVNIYRRDENGRMPAYRADSPLQSDPAWKELCLFYEYFHGETGQGLGAAHQTGWTGLMANLVMRQYRRDIPSYWRERGEKN